MPAILPPYQEELEIEPGLLGRLGRTGLSGVAAVGNALDLFGSSARDVLALENPLDQWLTPFSSENRTSGRDLLRKAGLASQQDTVANFWGGMGLEVLLDPFLWTGAGSLLTGAKVATSAGSAGARGLLRASVPFTKIGVELGTGARAEKFAELGLGALAKAKSAAAASLPGRAGRMLFDPSAGGVLDELGQKISTPLYEAQRGAEIELRRRMSDVAKDINEARELYAGIYVDDIAGLAKQQLDEATPKAAPGTVDMSGAAVGPVDPAFLGADDLERVSPPILTGPKAAATTKAATARGKIADDLTNSFFNRLMRHVADTGSLDDGLKQLALPAEKMTPELGQRVVKIVETMRKAAGKSYDDFLEMGGDGAKLEELTADALPSGEAVPGTQHFPRYAGGVGGMIEKLRRLFTKPGSAMGRIEEIRHLPSDVVNKILTDPKARGEKAIREAMQRKGAKHFEIEDAVKAWKDAGGQAGYIEQTWGKWLGRELLPEREMLPDEVLKPGAILREEGGKSFVREPRWESAAQHSQAVADWARQHSQFPIFTNSVLDDFYHYEHQVNTANLTLKTIHNLLADTIGEAVTALDNGVPIPEGATGYIPVGRVFSEGAKMNAQRGGEYLSKVMSEKLGKTVSAADVLKMQVPEEVANAIAAVKRVHDEPEWFRTIGSAIDEITDCFKSNVTIPFPAFWNRNLIGGQWINLTTGFVNSPQDAADYVAAFRDTWKLLKDVDADALSEMFIEGVINPNMLSEGIELSGRAVPQFTDFRHPFNLRQSYGEVAQQVTESPLPRGGNPLLNSAAAVGDAARTGYGTWMRTGEKVSGAVEYMNRATMYTYLKRKGWAPRQAAEKVLELQIDYGKLTPFERNVMKRLVPFYSWHRGIAPVILGTLARYPAGAMSQTIRASRLASSDDPRMPEWLGETLAIENPLGSSEPGGRSYVTGLGLPHESTLAFLGGGLRGFGRESLSQLNPLVKAPLEWSTGQSFFQTGPDGAGRPLDEMNPPIGQTLANVARFAGRDPSEPVPTPALLEFAVANSPASRYVTTARQITDPRKNILSLAANQLTGVRVTDISPQAQDAILRGRVNALMKQIGGREFKQTYFPKDATPADQELAANLQELLKELAKRGRARRAAEAGA